MISFQWYGALVESKIKGRMNDALETIGLSLQARIVKSFTTSPSKPFGPPGRDTGVYATSIGYSVDRQSMVCRVGSWSELGIFLELGTGVYGPKKQAFSIRTKTGRLKMMRGMQPRPHILPAIQKSKTFIIQLLKAQTHE